MRRSGIMAMAACLALAGCGGGSGSNNDQGIAVRFLGVFQETQEQVAPAADRLPDEDNAVGDTGRVISLDSVLAVPNDLNGDGDLDGGFLGIQNDLDQSINVQRVDVRIFIPGARLTNPVVTDQLSLAITLPPAAVDEEGVRTSSKTFAQTIFVPPDVIAFLNQNQTLLPAFPFTMNVSMTITAVSDTGDTFETNEVTYTVQVIQ
jgi:hypothetical protein